MMQTRRPSRNAGPSPKLSDLNQSGSVTAETDKWHPVTTSRQTLRARSGTVGNFTGALSELDLKEPGRD